MEPLQKEVSKGRVYGWLILKTVKMVKTVKHLIGFTRQVKTVGLFATGEDGETPNRIFVLGQCMDDLSLDDCDKCFSKISSQLIGCFLFTAGRVFLDGCFMRFDNYSFYEEIASEIYDVQARKESEALAAEGGWTVVVHHKGRKKTDTESGITVGSVAHAAVLENMAKKKSKDVGLDFYRFQKREAQRNEIMTLQSKFEQDKKRIQQLRAARKFRPY